MNRIELSRAACLKDQAGSGFIGRTFPDNSPQNVAVFLAAYAFGIWLGADYERRSPA